jgi:hypothetical protein
MRRQLIKIWLTGFAAGGCVIPVQPPLTTKNTVPPLVVGTLPSLRDGGLACTLSGTDGGGLPVLASGVAAQVVFSEAIDPASLDAGLSLFKCPCSPGQTPLPLLLAFDAGSQWPDYAQTNPFTVFIQPAQNGTPCLPDGGTFGCFSNAVYQLQVNTWVTDSAGNALVQACQLDFHAL